MRYLNGLQATYKWDILGEIKDINLEPQTTIIKLLFQLDDSKSLHRKWLFHQTSTLNWLFGVPGKPSKFLLHSLKLTAKGP